MRSRPTPFWIAAAALAVATVSTAEAAAPNILRYVIAGGGTRSTGGNFRINGTVGQALAGPITGPMTGGTYVVRNGFWPGDGPIPCIADYNQDQGVDILDFLDFFEDFDDCTNLPAPCGTLGDPDMNGDTVVDILDFLDFFEAFSDGC